MKTLYLLLVVLASQTAAHAASIYADDGTYLGELKESTTEVDSVNNPTGLYGSDTEPNSINNKNGPYYIPTPAEKPKKDPNLNGLGARKGPTMYGAGLGE